MNQFISAPYKIITTLFKALIAILIVGAFSLYKAYVKSEPSKNRQWEDVLKASALLTNNSEEVAKLIKIAQYDRYIFNTDEDLDSINTDSDFMKEIEKNFGEEYVDWIELEPTKEELPYAIFKTVLSGFEWMGYMDWKDVYDLDEMTWHFNHLLKKHELASVSTAEKEQIREKLSLLNEDHNLIAETTIQAFETLIEKRGFKILWFSESSDSFACFIVNESVFNKLNNTRLGEEHIFKYE